jgi:UDP-N-acetyl-D-mannosaminuronate dehydrogenase
VTDHSKVDYAGVVRNARLIVDTRNALKNHQSDKVVRL